MKLIFATAVIAVILFGARLWQRENQSKSGAGPSQRVGVGSVAVVTHTSSLPAAPSLPPALAKAASGLRSSFQPGVSRFARARQMVVFDELWQEDPPITFFINGLTESDSPREYRAYLAACLRKAGKMAGPERRDEIVSLLERALRAEEVEITCKPDLAHTLMMFDDRPGIISKLAALSNESNDDRLRASFLAALSRSRNSKAALLTLACEMSETPNRWATSLAVIVPPLILSGDALEFSTLEKIFTDTQSVDLLQRSAQALARIPAAASRDQLRDLLITRLSQLSHTFNQ